MLNIDASITQFVQGRKNLEDGCGEEIFREFEKDGLAYLEHFRVCNERAIIDISHDTCSSDLNLKTIILEQKITAWPLPQPPVSRCRTD